MEQDFFLLHSLTSSEEVVVKAKDGVIERLNSHLSTEMTAISLYFLHAHLCKAWGLERLYQKFRDLSMEEMKDTEELIEHIIYLEGMPNMRLNPIQSGQTVLDQLNIGLELERNAVVALTEAIAHCSQVGDYTTRNMLEEMVREEEGHVDWYETQLETIEQVGLQNYLTQQIHA